jgi:catechol 2,3-dioxygenase-like lactoylglutathione lyase family enzyme
MQVKLTSLMVDDQSKALAFYTGVLGFLEKQNFPAGVARWISAEQSRRRLHPRANESRPP